MSFEDDIRQLFRAEDVEAMSFAFDLSSYDEVSDLDQWVVGTAGVRHLR